MNGRSRRSHWSVGTSNRRLGRTRPTILLAGSTRFRVPVVAVTCLLLVTAVLLIFPPGRAAADDGYWSLVGTDVFPYESSDSTTCQIDQGGASLTIRGNYDKDVFRTTSTWASPKNSYRGGETIELSLRQEITEYTYDTTGEDPGYLHQGLNAVNDRINAIIDDAGQTGAAHVYSRIVLTDASGEYMFGVSGSDGRMLTQTVNATVKGVFPAGSTDGDQKAIYVETGSGVARYTYEWKAGEAPAVVETEQGTADGSGPTTGKIPGPGDWWKWLLGAVLPGLVALGASLAGGLGGTAAAAPVRPQPPPAPPQRRFPLPPDHPTIGPPRPSKPLVDETNVSALKKTAWDVLETLAKGARSFKEGTINTITTGYKELWELGHELDPASRSLNDPRLFQKVDSPRVTLETLVHTHELIEDEMLESMNPTEELQSLNDPNMSTEGKAWAVSAAALKILNALLVIESLKGGPGEPVPGEVPEVPLETAPPKGPGVTEPVAPRVQRRMIKTKPVQSSPGPNTRVSKMTPQEAVTQAEQTVPTEQAAQYENFQNKVNSTVETFTEKVQSGEPITTKDVLEVTKDPAGTRQVLGKKPERPVPAEVTEAVKEGRRNIYGATDDGVAAELKKNNPKYAEGEVVPKEVSTGGAADAVGSTDRDIMYVHKKKVEVTGNDGTTRTVEIEEVIPREDVEAIHNKAFADVTGFDPAKPAEGYDKARWDKMSLEEKQAAHADQYQQNVIDRTSPEYIAEYSADRPADISPEQWDKMSLAEKQAAHTERTGKLTSDPAEMGKIYQWDKFQKLWEQGTPGKQVEALEGLSKTGRVAQEAAETSGKALDPQTLDALEIVNKGGDPAKVDQAVRNLGVQGGVEGLANRLRSMIEYKNVRVP